MATLSAGNTGLGNDSALGSATIAFTGGNVVAVTTPRILTNQVELQANATVITGQAMTLNGQINVTGGDRNLSFGTSLTALQTGTIGGNINLSEDGLAHTMTLGGSNENLTVSGTISDGAAPGAGTLLISNQFGTITLSGNNTGLTDTVVLNAAQFGNGTLVIGNNNALGSGTFFLGSSNAPQNGGNIFITGGDKTLANPFEINAGQNAAIYGTDNLTLTGVVTNFGQARKLTNDIASNKQLILTNTLNLAADANATQLPD